MNSETSFAVIGCSRRSWDKSGARANLGLRVKDGDLHYKLFAGLFDCQHDYLGKEQLSLFPQSEEESLALGA